MITGVDGPNRAANRDESRCSALPPAIDVHRPLRQGRVARSSAQRHAGGEGCATTLALSALSEDLTFLAGALDETTEERRAAMPGLSQASWASYGPASSAQRSFSVPSNVLEVTFPLASS